MYESTGQILSGTWCCADSGGVSRPLSTHLAMASAALLCALAVCFAFSPPADASSKKSMQAKAERAVTKVLGGWKLKARKATCRRARGSSAKASYVCRFQGRLRPASSRPALCRGKMRVRYTGRRWRKRAVAKRCKSSTAAPSAAAGSPHVQPAPLKAPSPASRPPASSPEPPSQQFGFSDNTVQAGAASAGQVADLLKQGGSNVARVTFDWRVAEPFEDDYHLEVYDSIYREYLARGVRPIFTILFSPWWTWEESVSCDQWTQDCTYPPGRAHDGDWREIAALIAARYPRAAGIEIWNEPNLHWFWRPRPDVARYTELQKHAYAAIKSVSPTMPVVSAGLHNHLRTDEDDVSMTDFANGIYQNGGKNSMDALNFHPYPWGHQQADFLESFAAIRKVRDSHGDGAKPLWVTEFGLSTTGDDPLNVFTAEQQASGLASDYRQIRAMRDVDVVTIHTLVEPKGWRSYDPLDREVGFGVVDRYLRPKAAFCALAAERGVQAPCTPTAP